MNEVDVAAIAFGFAFEVILFWSGKCLTVLKEFMNI